MKSLTLEIKTFAATKNVSATRLLGLAVTALLLPAGLAAAYDGGAYHRDAGAYHREMDASGHVDVVHQMPGGTVTVGADWGKPHPTVVEERRVGDDRVVVVEKRPEHDNRQVTVIREVPQRRYIVIEKHGRWGHEKKFVVVERLGRDGRWYREEERDYDGRNDWRYEGHEHGDHDYYYDHGDHDYHNDHYDYGDRCDRDFEK